jgi:hypothetical protein
VSEKSFFVVQKNLQRSRPNQHVEDHQKAGDVAGVILHERVNGGIGASFGLLTSLGAEGEGLAEDHGLNGSLDVDRAAGHAIPAKVLAHISLKCKSGRSSAAPG